jgi:hypothetical protein
MIIDLPPGCLLTSSLSLFLEGYVRRLQDLDPAWLSMAEEHSTVSNSSSMASHCFHRVCDEEPGSPSATDEDSDGYSASESSFHVDGKPYKTASLPAVDIDPLVDLKMSEGADEREAVSILDCQEMSSTFLT